MEYKLSIIVPVYNAEKYLEKCVESLKNQTLSDLQIILVDDGSKDASGRICDDFATKDKRIQVIHKENGGVSSARNAGLDGAQGEYICFVDADDWLEAEAMDVLYRSAKENNADSLIYDPYIHNECGDVNGVDTLDFFDNSVLLKRKDITPDELRFMAGTVWRCLYRQSILKKNGIKFNEALPLSEDRIFNLEVFGCSEQIYYLKKPLYHYLNNSGSAVHKYRADFLEIVLETNRATIDVLERYWDDCFKPCYEKVVVVDGALLCVYNEFSPQNPESIRTRFSKIKQIVSNEVVHEAVRKIPNRTMRQRLLYRKCTAILCIVGVLWNVKNR